MMGRTSPDGKPKMTSAVSPVTVRGFAVVHGTVEEDRLPIAVWLVAYGGRLASNVNAVVLDPADPARQAKLDSLLWRQLITSTSDPKFAPVASVCQGFVDEALMVGSFSDLPAPTGRRAPRSETPAHHALAAADDLVASWNFWLRTVRKAISREAPKPPVIPPGVWRMVAPAGPVKVAGGEV